MEQRSNAVAKGAERTVLTKNIKASDPVPESGIADAVAIMETGKMYRYSKVEPDSPVSLCEVEVAAYTGHKYCVALNSCGSALYLMLLAAGVKPGDLVMTNAFTFIAVPSAIHHAAAKPVYVESNSDYVMDLKDLEKKIAETGAKYLMISHMRGRIADMDECARICKENGVVLLEDCAHSIGVLWGDGTAENSKHTGHHGVACAISSQSYKMLNSGEGGFYLTDDGVMAAKVAVYAGAYEEMCARHIAAPPREVFADLPSEIPNYSMRMNCLAAAVIRPQVKTLEERVEKYNRRFFMLAERLSKHPNVQVPKHHPKVRCCGDSLQFNLLDVSDEQVETFMRECKAHKLMVELFGAPSNARNFSNWKFSLPDQPLPQTAAMIRRAIDIRLPLTWDDEDFVTMAQVVEESLEVAIPGVH